MKSNRKWRAACDKVGDAGGKRDAFCLSQSVPPRCTAETIPPVSSFEHGDGMERNLLQLPRRHGKLDFFFRVARLSLRPMRFSCLSMRLQSGYSQGSRPSALHHTPTLFIISRPSSRDEEDNGRVMGRHPCSWIRVWPLVMFTAV